MLSSTYRISPRSRVKYILEKGTRVRARFFQLRMLPTRFKHPRFAVVVSKKVAATAVARNLIKRRVYEVLRQNWLEIASVWYDTVVLVHSQAKSATYAELEKDLLLCLKKRSIVKNSLPGRSSSL